MNILIIFSFFIIVLPSKLWAKKVPAVTLNADFLYFSPDKDGVQDQVTFQPKLQRIKSLSGWELQVRDAIGTIRRTFSGTKKVPESIVWDGADDFGAPCSEGSYPVLFSIWYSKNKQLDAPSLKIGLDLTPPTLSLSSEEKSARVVDELLILPTFYFSARDFSGISDWKLKLQDENKQELYSHSASGTPPPFWKVPSFTAAHAPTKITALFFVTDPAGNSGTAVPLDLSLKKQRAKKPIETASPAPAPRSQPAEKSKEYEGPFLQMTTIIFLSELFGTEAEYDSPLLSQARILLNPVAKVLQDNPGSRIIVLAHVDAGKSPEEDRALSSYFAWRVFSFLVREKGVDREAISVRGMGSAVPIATNQTSLGRSRNRRIEIQFFLPQE